MDSYANTPSWHRYRQLLLDTFGIPIRHVPIERRKTVLGHDVHLDEWRSEGRSIGTLILVHGGGGNGRILAPLADFAAGLGWRALAPDLPGYGLTRPRADFSWDYGEWPAVVAALADDCQGPVVLLGLSVGGMTLNPAVAAKRWPDSLVLARTCVVLAHSPDG